MKGKAIARRTALVIPSLVVMLVTAACEPIAPKAHEDRPRFTGPYLGQPLPGEAPQPFAVDLVGGPYDVRDTAWVADGDRVFFTVWGQGRGTIVTVERDGDLWGAPEIAPFSGRFSDLEAFVSPAGDELYFASKRPLTGGTEEKDWDLWVVRRTDTGWSKPANLGPTINTAGGEYYPSLTADGTLYFTAEREDTLGGEDIYCARRLSDGSWAEPENLGPAINSPGPEFNALIAPDGSFLIFGSVRDGDVGGGDLHISFRANDGSWLPAVNPGEPVNSPTLDYCPALSPDGRLLFFTSRRLPATATNPTTFGQLDTTLRGPFNGSSKLWWVDAGVIEALRPH